MTFFQPPKINHSQSPYARVPLPPQYPGAGPPTLDPMLQSRLEGAVITWLVCEHPSKAITQMVVPDGQFWPNWPATHPRTSALTIWSTPTEDRPIVVRGEPYVTIGDVLVHVYEAIRRAAREHFQPTPQPLLIHPHSYPQYSPVPSEQQVQQWVMHYLNGRFTWRGLAAYEVDSWWLDIR